MDLDEAIRRAMPEDIQPERRGYAERWPVMICRNRCPALRGTGQQYYCGAQVYWSSDADEAPPSG